MSRVKYASLVVLLFCGVTPLQAEAQPFMDWPMGESINSVPVMGYKAHIRRRFAAAEPGWKDGREHTGIDLYWDNEGTSVSTEGAPVYAAISGVVACLPSTSFTPGTVVVLSHKDTLGNTFYSMYGHVEPEPWLQVGQVVNRGEPIALVAANPEDSLQAHLHFELRDWPTFSGTDDCMGPGYAPSGQTAVGKGWRDPVDFYYNHRPLPENTTAYVDREFNIRAQPSASATALAEDNPAGSPLIVTGVHSNTLENLNGTEWWYAMHYDDGDSGPTTAYVAGARPEPQSGQYGTFLNVGEVRYLDDTCQCAWGADQYDRPITPRVTYCGYHVCGADDFAYECTSAGWVFKGIECISPPATQCESMNDIYGPTDPAETYIGMRVCSPDARIYECTASGWSVLEALCD